MIELINTRDLANNKFRCLVDDNVGNGCTIGLISKDKGWVIFENDSSLYSILCIDFRNVLIIFK